MGSDFRRKFLIQLGVAAAVSAALVAAAGWFAADVSVQAGRVAQDRTLIRERSASIAVLAELKRNSARALQYEQKMNAFLPTQEQLLDFRRTLENLARVRRLTLNFSFQGGQTLPRGGAPGTVGFALDVAGASIDVLGFLKDVEVTPPRFLAAFDTFSIEQNAKTYRLFAGGRVFFR
ncbi:MAG: hypothetical protein HYW65_04170 [Candidatus Liptonbacteria bacterium]|nr:hypothetical protein [Candidatus Liptonbacteria bacterium]